LEQFTSVRTIPNEESVSVSILSSSIGSQKLGQPVPELYFVVDENSGVSQQTQR
jgi:hypothetical protein